MKKEYTAPQIEVIEIGGHTIMAASGIAPGDSENIPEPDTDDEFWAD